MTTDSDAAKQLHDVIQGSVCGHCIGGRRTPRKPLSASAWCTNSAHHTHLCWQHVALHLRLLLLFHISHVQEAHREHNYAPKRGWVVKTANEPVREGVRHRCQCRRPAGTDINIEQQQRHSQGSAISICSWKLLQTWVVVPGWRWTGR